MARKYALEMLTVAAIIVFCGLFLYTSATREGAEFTGTDTVGSGQIAELSKKPVGDFTPLIPQWKPPGGEVEASLFALQAAVGGILVGGVFGYWLGERKKSGGSDHTTDLPGNRK